MPNRYDNTAPGSSSEFVTTVPTTFTGVAGGANRVTYLATPPDVVARRTGLQAPPFTNYPLRVI